MQITVGCILLVVFVAMVVIARPTSGQDTVLWLSKPWMLGQVYVLASLVTAVIGVSFILNAWPS
jgi:hypothetical protein